MTDQSSLLKTRDGNASIFFMEVQEGGLVRLLAAPLCSTCEIPYLWSDKHQLWGCDACKSVLTVPEAKILVKLSLKALKQLQKRIRGKKKWFWARWFTKPDKALVSKT